MESVSLGRAFFGNEHKLAGLLNTSQEESEKMTFPGPQTLQEERKKSRNCGG